MTAEPGWYYAPGDRENTLRRWNGEQWIGFPIEQRSNEGAGPSTIGVKPFRRIPGHVSLSGLAAAASVALVLLIGAHGFLAFTVWQNSQYDAVRALDTLEPAPATTIVTAFTGVVLVGLLAGFLFIAWFATAYRNLSRWHRTARAPGWPIIVFFVPFVQYRWPWDMMLELIESSARKEHQGAISPFPVLGWWVMWTGHQSLFLASMGLSRYTDFGVSSYYFGIGGSVFAIIGICFAIFLMHKISQAQDSRLRPTAAQRALMGQGQPATVS